MPEVDIPTGYSELEQLPKTKELLRNMWNVNGTAQQRPGIETLSSAPSAARGAFTFNDRMYHVYGETLYRIDANGNIAATIGTVAGTNAIDTSNGFNDCVIIDISSAGKGYTLTTGEVLTEITSIYFKPSRSVTHIDGRHVFVPYDGSPAFYSDVGDGSTIQFDAFFDAEQLPDKNTVAINWNNLLYIGGENSFEGFRPGTGTPVYQRITGRIETGYIGGMTKYKQSQIFVGRHIDLNRGIFELQQGGSRRISNEAIELILKQYSIALLEQIIVNRWEWSGVEVVTFVLPNDSFAYVEGEWVIFDTKVAGIDLPWRGGYMTAYQGAFYCAYNNQIGKLSRINKDFDETFTREILVPFQHPRNSEFSMGRLTLVLSQGFSSNDGSIGLRLSDDNVVFGPTLFRDVSPLGVYNAELDWTYPGGLGYYYGFAGVSLICTDDIYFSAQLVVIDLAGE